jgi:hypothetical protein
MPEIKTLNERWNEFAARLHLDKPEVPEVQRKEMKRAFFVGCETMFICQLECSNIEDEQAACDRLERFHQEIKGFGEAVKMNLA